MSESLTSNQKLPLLEWVLERFENCCRIARQKEEPADRDSWMEDAEYFRQILVVLSGKQPSGRQPVETSEKQTLALDILALMTRHVLPQEFKQEVIALCSAVEPSGQDTGIEPCKCDTPEAKRACDRDCDGHVSVVPEPENCPAIDGPCRYVNRICIHCRSPENGTRDETITNKGNTK